MEIFQEIGFDEKEENIYKILLKIGASPASKVASELGYDRTTTYYALLRMLEKGYVSQTIKNNAKTFAATPPNQILGLIKERENKFKAIIPSLEEMQKNDNEPLKVEVRQGKEGFRHLSRDALQTGGEVLGIGVDDSQYMEIDDISMKQYYREAESRGMVERLITYKGAKIYGKKITEYRYVDKEYFQPTPIFIYGETTSIICWQPTLYIIFIRSNELADAFRKHFELLWNLAEPAELQTKK